MEPHDEEVTDMLGEELPKLHAIIKEILPAE